MKKLFFIILFLGINILALGSNVYFLNDGQGYLYTNGQTFYSDSTGRALIAYHLWADPAKYSVDEWGANFQDPDGNWSGWSHNSSSEGLYECLKAGTWHARGRVHVVQDIYGYTDYWMYTNTLEFYVVDNYAPAIPTGIGSTSYNNHPKITWSANSEYDLDNYSVYKKDGGSSYNFLASTSNTYYVDNSETIYSIGNDKTYVYYKVKANDINGNSSALSNNVSFAVNAPLSKKAPTAYFESNEPVDFCIKANYPNPFNPSTTITYQLPKSGYTTLKIYNSLGQVVAELVDGYEEAGIYAILFNADNLPSGMYFATLQMNNISQTRKMILLK